MQLRAWDCPRYAIANLRQKPENAMTGAMRWPPYSLWLTLNVSQTSQFPDPKTEVRALENTAKDERECYSSNGGASCI